MNATIRNFQKDKKQKESWLNQEKIAIYVSKKEVPAKVL